MERINLLSVDIHITSLDLKGGDIHHEVFAYGRPPPEQYSAEHKTELSYDDTVLKNTPLMQEVKTAIEEETSKILTKKYKVAAMWGVVLQKGQSVEPHSHKSNSHLNPHEYFSVAYYPTAGFSDAKLVFSVPYANSHETVRHIQPTAGMLVIFPSYLTHWTTRQMSNTRVVLSANVEPVEPDTELLIPHRDTNLFSF
ncbi:MAG: hypothetical protein CL489_15495 [Acidobacteria bacterium]|nr:hypothetical protein [Acidobacteriota bacterium]